MRTQSGSHLDFSLVRPWAGNPALSWPDFWPKEKAKIVIACYTKRGKKKKKKKRYVLSLFFTCWPSLLATGIPTCSKYNFLETKYLKCYQSLTSPLGLFAFLHSDPYSWFYLSLFLFTSRNVFACLFFVISKVIDLIYSIYLLPHK